MDRSLTKHIKNRTESGWNDLKKNKREQNDLAVGPLLERNVKQFLKSQNVPSYRVDCKFKLLPCLL